MGEIHRKIPVTVTHGKGFLFSNSGALKNADFLLKSGVFFCSSFFASQVVSICPGPLVN